MIKKFILFSLGIITILSSYSQISKKAILLILLVLITRYLPGQSNCFVIDYNTSVKFDKDDIIEENSFIIQINDQESNWISDIEIPFKENEEVDILEAAIVDLEGNVVREIKKKEIITKSDISHGTFFEDVWIKEFKLKWHEYPYLIKYKYRITKKNYLYLTRWTPLVYPNIGVRSASLRVILPIDYKINSEYSDTFDFKVDTIKNNCIFEWRITDVNSISYQPFSPSIHEIIPLVVVVPHTFYYGSYGDFVSWNSYGQWQFDINHYRVNNLTM